MTLNRFSFIGRLGKDAEVKSLDGGKVVIKFSVAVTERWKTRDGEKKEKTDWIECEIWDNSGKANLAQYIRKGNEIYVEGKPYARGWVKDDGTLVTVQCVRVTDVQLLSSGKSQSSPTGEGQSGRTDYPVYKPENDMPFEVPMNLGDDDLPF